MPVKIALRVAILQLQRHLCWDQFSWRGVRLKKMPLLYLLQTNSHICTLFQVVDINWYRLVMVFTVLPHIIVAGDHKSVPT
ncbi:hypothetical protein L596_026487 [Steinernema carpocapsae]|uniref:Uncharacterized protein n=1 Tax=Steinernema carpocapsae TaxID=34508 RepID=A0A4U5M1J2_STECR|nr:hypothetical protein L596_026487 [Steinernema carpocapsae]